MPFLPQPSHLILAWDNYMQITKENRNKIITIWQSNSGSFCVIKADLHNKNISIIQALCCN